MPSPFPGMDPYLESPDWFPCLHDGLIFGILESLQSRLPEPYYAQSTQRVWLELSHRSVEPDVNVIHPARRISPWPTGNGGVAVADEIELAEPVVITVQTTENDPFDEPFIEIRRRQGSEVRLVATIEVLSPANKTLGSPGARNIWPSSLKLLQVRFTSSKSIFFAGVRMPPRFRATSPSSRLARSITTSACIASTGPNDFLVYPDSARRSPARNCNPTLARRPRSAAVASGRI